MSFINLNNHTGHSTEYSVKVVKEALLAIETKNVNKVNALLEGLSGNITLSEAISLFSNKLNAMSALDTAKLNNIDQIIEAKANLVEIKAGGKKIKVDIDTVEIEGIDTRDYPDFVDAFFSYAEDHRGKKLSDDELDILTDEHSDLINELIFDQQLYAGLIIAEGKSINKIQKEWAGVTADMASTVKVWKTSEGETKTQLLDKLKALSIRKKELEVELDHAVMGKDKNVELSGAFESVLTEGAVKRFETGINDMIKNIKRGYGWIDPEFVADTWENTSDSIDFELVKGEIYKRLIAAGLLAYADSDNEEKAGKKVKSLKELGIKESLDLIEGRSINKIHKEYGKVVNDMTETVAKWKASEGDAKIQFLEKLKALTARKKELEIEIDTAVMGKDKNVELSGAFESVVVEAVKLSLDVEEPFNINKEKAAASKFKWIPNASPVTISRVEGEISDDKTDLTIHFTNGDKIYYNYNAKSKYSMVFTGISDSYKVLETLIDNILGSTSTVVGDIALIYSIFKDGKKSSSFSKY